MASFHELGHRILIRVQDPSLLLGEIKSGRAEKVYQLISSLTDRPRRVDGGCRDHRHRYGCTLLMLVSSPFVHIGNPRPTDVMDEYAFHGEGDLLEIIMNVGGHFGRVSWAVLNVEIIDHHGRTAPNTTEAPFLRGNVETIRAKTVAGRWCWPWFEGGDVRMRGRV